jgi:DNA-binding MarR family transcriptional regulator
MEPLDLPTTPNASPDPGAVDLPSTVPVTIDIGKVLGERALRSAKVSPEEFDDESLAAGNPRIEPMLGIISRSVQNAMEFLDLPHLRVLILLSHKDATSVAELASLMKLSSRRMMALLDSMEASGWVTSESDARGVGELVAISHRGRDLVETMTTQRQHEIDDILGRMSEADRTDVARAFNSLAAAAGEPLVRRAKKGLATD